jgi:hypothetical protein
LAWVGNGRIKGMDKAALLFRNLRRDVDICDLLIVVKIDDHQT